jgi:hypothetical protein
MVCNLQKVLASNLHVSGYKMVGCEGNMGLDLISGEPSEPADDHKPQSLRAGNLCPYCKTHKLDYDGQINLACPQCGVISGGCFT